MEMCAACIKEDYTEPTGLIENTQQTEHSITFAETRLVYQH